MSDNLDLFYTPLEISCFPDSFGCRSQLCNRAENVRLNLLSSSFLQFGDTLLGLVTGFNY